LSIIFSSYYTINGFNFIKLNPTYISLYTLLFSPLISPDFHHPTPPLKRGVVGWIGKTRGGIFRLGGGKEKEGI